MANINFGMIMVSFSSKVYIETVNLMAKKNSGIQMIIFSNNRFMLIAN